MVEPLPSRDHSERMLSAAGAEVRRQDGAVAIAAPERLEAGRIVVPADFSSAAFFLVGALLVPGSDVTLTGVGLNPTRTGLLGVLERMGADVEIEVEGELGGEPAGTIRARASGRCRAPRCGGAEVPLAIDELPLVALAACFAEGTTTIADAAELRRKESDRIATVAAALTALGGRVEATADGMAIEGTGGLAGGAVDSHGDHRIAMLGAIAGLASARRRRGHRHGRGGGQLPGLRGGPGIAALDVTEIGEGTPIVFVHGTHRRRRDDLAPAAPTRRALAAGDRRTGRASAPARRCRATTSRSRRARSPSCSATAPTWSATPTAP